MENKAVALKDIILSKLRWRRSKQLKQRVLIILWLYPCLELPKPWPVKLDQRSTNRWGGSTWDFVSSTCQILLLFVFFLKWGLFEVCSFVRSSGYMVHWVTFGCVGEGQFLRLGWERNFCPRNLRYVPTLIWRVWGAASTYESSIFHSLLNF